MDGGDNGGEGATTHRRIRRAAAAGWSSVAPGLGFPWMVQLGRALHSTRGRREILIRGVACLPRVQRDRAAPSGEEVRCSYNRRSMR